VRPPPAVATDSGRCHVPVSARGWPADSNRRVRAEPNCARCFMQYQNPCTLLLCPPPSLYPPPPPCVPRLSPPLHIATGAGGDNGIDHDKNWLTFPYVSICWRSHYLHSHPYYLRGRTPSQAPHVLPIVGTVGAPDSRRRLGSPSRLESLRCEDSHWRSDLGREGDGCTHTTPSVVSRPTAQRQRRRRGRQQAPLCRTRWRQHWSSRPCL
jgi:hypothetical protein